jgi:hypothetical protein
MNKPNIFKSRKFWLMIGDVVVSTAVYFVSHVVGNAQVADSIMVLIASWQPALIFVINGMTQEDTAYLNNVEAVNFYANQAK